MGGLGYMTEEGAPFRADQEIAEYAGATLLRRYVRLPGSVDEAFLMIDYTLSADCTLTSDAACQRWVHQNRLGSVVAVTDSVGAVEDRFTYSAYGVPGPEGPAGFPFRFTGQKLLDPETGLYYYKARYYDPETGRFLQTDPVGYADQMNLYAYVGNDPLNRSDPSGTEVIAVYAEMRFTFMHAGVIIGNPDDGYTFLSKEGRRDQPSRSFGREIRLAHLPAGQPSIR